jgi:N utilization substance protein A
MADDREDMIRQVFAEVVPEIAAGVVEVRAIARTQAGGSRIAVSSNDPGVDAVGVCTGERVAASGTSCFDNSRSATIFHRLDDEPLEIVRWSDSPQEMIANALMVAPELIERINLLHDKKRAIVTVKQDQVYYLEGPTGRNLAIASLLCGWDIELQVQ